MSLPLFANEYFSLKTGLYTQTNGSSDTELCDQNVRVLTDRVTKKLKGIYVTYTGQCISQGPYYYFCNQQNSQINQCKNIGHVFKLLGNDQYEWTNEYSGHSGVMKFTR